MGGGERGGGEGDDRVGGGEGGGVGGGEGGGGGGDGNGVGGGEGRGGDWRSGGGGEGMEKGAQLSPADPQAQESVVTGSHNGGGVDQPNTDQEFGTDGGGEGGEGDEEVGDQEWDEQGGMGEEGGEGELEKEMEARHTPPITADQTAGVERQVGGGGVDSHLVQQGGSDGGSSEISEQLNRAQVPEDTPASHLKTEQQPQFSQDLGEDSATVSEEVAASRGVPEHVQRWRSEQQSRLLEGMEPLPPPLFVGEQVGQQQEQKADREQEIEASKEGGGHSWDTYTSTAAYHDESQGRDGGGSLDAGEVSEQVGKEGQGWTADQGVGATEPLDDGRGDVDEQRVEEERGEGGEGGNEKAEEDERNNWEKLDLQGFGQTSFDTYFTRPIPSSTSAPPPHPVIPESQSVVVTESQSVVVTESQSVVVTESQSVVVTESPMAVVTESPSEYRDYDDDDEDLDDGIEVRSLITRSGNYAEVQFRPDGSVRVVEEGRDPYYLQLKSTQDGFTADGIDDLMNDVIRLIGGGPQEPDPVDQDSVDAGTHTHLPSSMPVPQSSPPTLEPAGSGHYRPPGDYLNLDAIRQRMRGEQQLHHHHQQQHPPPQYTEYQARIDTMVTGHGQTGFSTTGLHPIPTVSVPPKVEITETETDLPDFVDARDKQVEEDSFLPPPLTPESYIQEPPSEGGTPPVLSLEEEQEQEGVPPVYGGGGEDQKNLEEDQLEKVEDQPEKMEDWPEKVDEEKLEQQSEVEDSVAVEESEVHTSTGEEPEGELGGMLHTVHYLR